MASSNSKPNPPVAKLTRQRGRPLWLQLRDDLNRRILQNEFAGKNKLPTEQQLCEYYGVSRTAAREAVGSLVNDRIVYRVQGSGAYVVKKSRDTDSFVGTSLGFSGEMVSKGAAFSSKVLTQELGAPSDTEMKMLKISAESKVCRIGRVLSVDGAPRISVFSTIPSDIAPGLVDANLEGRPLNDVLRRRYGLVPTRAERWIEAVAATPEQAKLMDVAVGHPLVEIESVVQMANQEPLEYYRAYYRSDQARLKIVVSEN